MKTTLLLLLSFLTMAAAQTATPAPATPVPFDALKVLAKPGATPTPTLVFKQAQHKAQVRSASSILLIGLAKQYTALLALTATDDSATGGLTTAQKAAALTTAEKTELLTNAWLIANLLNGIAPGTVPNPPAP